ncbi:pro-MCH [Stigmatopora argus]
MSSVGRVVLALLLFSGLSRPWVAGIQDDRDNGELPLDLNAALRGDLLWDVADENGSPKVVLLDTKQRSSRFRGLDHRPRVTDDLRWSRTAPVETLARRDTDIEMLRCMIGRVYRPCWGGT